MEILITSEDWLCDERKHTAQDISRWLWDDVFPYGYNTSYVTHEKKE